MLWIQQVDVIYTKRARGAPAATMRNRLPRAFAMAAPAAAYAFAHVRQLERGDLEGVPVAFAVERVSARTAAAAPEVEGDVGIALTAERATLALRWSPAVGQPPRAARTGIALEPGQVARLIINGRVSTHDEPYYLERTINVALGAALAPDVFVAAPPTTIVDLRADLF
ncbi:MAG: hypothetical protein IPL61_39295 [Myxococcales bacterium]|nr:hypothetical protein [Myxococcales bacterium]